jgi:hypothetical protein
MITINLPAPPAEDGTVEAAADEDGTVEAATDEGGGVAVAGATVCVAVVLEQAPATRPTIAIAGQSRGPNARMFRSSF